MQQRDILKDQIENLGKVLGKLTSKFLNLDPTEDIESHIEVTNEQLKSELDIDLDKILYFTENELKDFVEKRNLTVDHLEQLSEYLIKIGLSKNNKDIANLYFIKAIELLECANDVSQMISFDRIKRIKEIDNIIFTKK